MKVGNEQWENCVPSSQFGLVIGLVYGFVCVMAILIFSCRRCLAYHDAKQLKRSQEMSLLG